MEPDNQLIERPVAAVATNAPQIINPSLCSKLIEDIPEVVYNEVMAKKQLEKEGKEIYDSNKTMQDFAWFMEDPVTREMYDKYFNNWGDITSTMLFLKLYEKLDKYLNKKNIVLNGYHKLALINKLMKDDHLRHMVCQNMADWIRETVHPRLDCS